MRRQVHKAALRMKLMALLCVVPATTTEGESSSAVYGAVSLRRSINYRLLGCKQAHESRTDARLRPTFQRPILLRAVLPSLQSGGRLLWLPGRKREAQGLVRLMPLIGRKRQYAYAALR
jgi:hypothetical protein